MIENQNISDNELLVASVEKIDTSIGERTRIVYVDTTALLRGSRLADELFASVMKPGQKVRGSILKAKPQARCTIVSSHSFLIGMTHVVLSLHIAETTHQVMAAVNQ